MKKILLILSIFAMFLNAEIISKTTTKTSSGEGYGANYEEALSKALNDALGRMNGVKMSSKTNFVTNSIHDNKNANLQKTYNEIIKKSTKGRFDSYDVLSKNQTSNGMHVKVRIKKSYTTKSYKTPGFSPNSRRKIAVFPAYSSFGEYDVLGKVYSRQHISNILTQEVVNAITQTRKFSVLDREAKDAYEREKKLISIDGHKNELVKIGKVLGTDYMYVLSIDDFSIKKDDSASDLIGVDSDDVVTNATIDYRIIVMATRQVKYSNSKIFSFSTDGENDAQYFRNSLKTIAKSLTDDIINNIYPQKIVDVKGDEVIISSKLNLGDMYEVYSLGKMMYDPYTKEQIGRVESKIGSIKITRVSPKMSYAKIVQGKAYKGNICRLISDSGDEDITEAQKPSDIQQKTGGGVVLPFD